MTHYIGLDLGGTNVKAGVVDDRGRSLSKLSMPTVADQGPDAVMDLLAEAARRAVADAGMTLKDVAGIGVGCPGVMDAEAGLIVGAPNLPGFRDVPVNQMVRDRTGLPTFVENDANAAAMGEFWAGSGKAGDVRDLVMLTLGTGIGGGIITDGHVFHGGFNIGAEIGHLIINVNGDLCGCGQRGCLEAYASATNTVRRASEAITAGGTSSLKNGQFTAQDVFEAAKAGDELATKIIDETALYLGVAVVSLCRLLDPKMVVFAGGMILAGDMLFDRIRQAVDQHNWNITEPRVQIVPAKLGNDAGFIGAAAVVWDAIQSGRLKVN